MLRRSRWWLPSLCALPGSQAYRPSHLWHKMLLIQSMGLLCTATLKVRGVRNNSGSYVQVCRVMWPAIPMFAVGDVRHYWRGTGGWGRSIGGNSSGSSKGGSRDITHQLQQWLGHNSVATAFVITVAIDESGSSGILCYPVTVLVTWSNGKLEDRIT